MGKMLSLILLAILTGFSVLGQNDPEFLLVDPKVTSETQILFYNLKKLSENHILFGHQHATEYGHGWKDEPGRSDVKSITGSHPAVIGVDFSGLSGKSLDEIEKNKQSLRQQISDTYNRGGITTISWHFNNPVTPTGFYWKDSVSAPAVKNIIPGGSHHKEYKEILGTIADLAHTSKGKNNELIPMIFRPYHEFDGDWFWWGKSHCTKEEFKSLWRFTVSYLRDSLNVHNFLYAFSPDCTFKTEAEFLDRYPGDKWVDMVGMDNYADFGREGKYNLKAAIKKLKIISEYAERNGKLAALTETGLESIPNQEWWTNVLLKSLKKDNIKLSYILVWRNDSKSPTHYYAPFPGHSSVPDFMKFYNDPFTLFENDLGDIYKEKM